jgi:hypothetical protein
MDDLDGQLRNAFDEPPPLTLDEIRTRADDIAPAGKRRPAILVAIVAALIAIGGGVVVVTRSDTRHNPRIAVAATSTTSTSVGSTTSSIGVATGATIRVTLDRTHAPADGTPIQGSAVIENNTGQVIDAPSGLCVGWLAVGLSNAHIHFKYATPAVICAPFEIPPGVSRYPVTVSTEYSSCSTNGDSADPEVPPCLGPDHNQSPPLPPGTYAAKVFGPPSTIELPLPTTVTLTAPTG